MKTIPVVGLAGYSGSGKTTFLEKLIVELKGRGYRLGIIKHTHHPVEWEQPGKDTWRHARAGADVVALAAPDGVFVSRKCVNPGPADAIALVGEVDLIIVEGFKKEKWPKIEVYARGIAERPDLSGEERLAVVSETPLGGEVPWFAPDDAPGVADLIELEVLKKEAVF